ncbi:hypothetical protein BDV25DRAFT_156353 [Aspergillus avenaceus]|uniref:Ubiquitin-like domain-containing protein n=1 Tax=Aspergillus avenaceus TaxID=36643 RepID=A0A5N6TSU5_ASPAV|nr:hypothetical protein BDV25DRAFT_156353 [Aspergillus avenaceus]
MTSAATSDNSSSLKSSMEGQGFILHILCPTLPSPNRFTFNDLVPSVTVATLKTRICQTIPNRPPPDTQRLIYRGRPLTDNNATLQSVLQPENGAEYSIHLALPPAPLSQDTTPSRPPTVPQFGSSADNNLFASSRSAPPHLTHHGQGIRYRGTLPPSEADIGLALRRNIDAIRRQIESQEQGGSPLPDQQGLGLPQSINWQRATESTPESSTTTSAHTSLSTTSDLGANLPQDSRLRLHILRPQIALCEDQLNRGIAPPMDQIIRIRSQLFDILDDQYQNPLSERDGTIEALLTRVFNIYTRADQLRVSHSRAAPTPQHNISNTPTNNGTNQAPLYVLQSPDGYQALVTPSGPSSIATALGSFSAMQAAPTFPTHNIGNAPHVHPNANAAMENAVRQAVLHQRGRNNERMGLGRSIRRIWLFVRLYFFCYMFSEPGTWSRVFLVTLAVIISLLSETSVPRQLYELIVSPLRRHLEGLVHFPMDDHAHPQRAATEGTMPPAGPATGIRHNLRRAERSLALFIASLVPGVGERQVEVRNAAEAARNAERAREEEERRQQEANAETEQGHQSDATAQPDPVQNQEIPTAVPPANEHAV